MIASPSCLGYRLLGFGPKLWWEALQRVDLIPWLSDFARDLERFRNRLGVWKSLNEFIAFNRHVERLLWAVGLFPWESSEGVRVEIPLASDAAALLAQRAEDDA